MMVMMMRYYQRGKDLLFPLSQVYLLINSSLIYSVHKMRDEYEAVLSRMSHEFSESPRRIAFLINNYDLIVSVFQVRFIYDILC
jgi:hypothetical protein